MGHVGEVRQGISAIPAGEGVQPTFDRYEGSFCCSRLLPRHSRLRRIEQLFNFLTYIASSLDYGIVVRDLNTPSLCDYRRFFVVNFAVVGTSLKH